MMIYDLDNENQRKAILELLIVCVIYLTVQILPELYGIVMMAKFLNDVY